MFVDGDNSGDILPTTKAANVAALVVAEALFIQAAPGFPMAACFFVSSFKLSLHSRPEALSDPWLLQT